MSVISFSSQPFLRGWDRESENDLPNVPSSMATPTTTALISSEHFKSSASILPSLPRRFSAANTKNHRRFRCALSSSNWRKNRRLVSISLLLSNLFLIPDRMRRSVHRIICCLCYSCWMSQKWKNSMNKSFWTVLYLLIWMFSLQMPLPETYWIDTWRSKQSYDLSFNLPLSAEVHQTDSHALYSGKSWIRLKFMFQPSYWRSYRSKTSVIKHYIFCVSVVFGFCVRSVVKISIMILCETWSAVQNFV